MTGKGVLSAEQLAAVLDNAPAAISVSALKDGELLYANQAARKLFLGESSFEKEEQKGTCPVFREAKTGQAGLLIHKVEGYNSNRIYQIQSLPIDLEGMPAQIEYVQDITERKHKGNQLETMKGMLQTRFRSIPIGLCVYLFDGEQITPIFHNPAYYDILGYAEEDIRRLEKGTNLGGSLPDNQALLEQKVREIIKHNGLLSQTYRIFHDRAKEYRWVHLEGSVKSLEDGTRLLYAMYSDVSGQMQMELEISSAAEKMRDIVNAIPGGIAIYQVSDIFETLYFSDGLPKLFGYTMEEYGELVKHDTEKLAYLDDTHMVANNLREVIRNHTEVDLEFRKQHQDGHTVWVRLQAKQIGVENGCPLLHCAFHNISHLKEAQLEIDHLINSIPGGIASYRVVGNRFIPTFFSEGVAALTGHTREEYARLVQYNAVDTVYEPDRERVLRAAQAALASGEVLDVSFRMRHKNGALMWLHLNGRRMGPLAEIMRFYGVFTGMSPETRLFQSIANDTADGIYVVDQGNYDLLYANEAQSLFMRNPDYVGMKCYAALHGNNAPCEFCILKKRPADGKENEMVVDEKGRAYSTRIREIDWNGIPSYVLYIRDITEEVHTRREKERLEQYFQTLVKKLPGGVGVVRYEQDGSMTAEFLSDGFAAMTGMTMEEAWRLYQKDAMAGVHPDDRQKIMKQITAYIAGGEKHCELVYRLKKGGNGYVWVKNTLSLIQNEGGESRLYASYQDITKEREEKELLRQQYNELILQHYRMPGPNALIIGHCNITKNKILEIIDHTNSALLETFGSVREAFFTGIASLVVDQKERQIFLDTYLNAPALAAFEKNCTEVILRCFIQLPREKHGRYARFKVNMVEAPDTGDVTGILTVEDITEQVISDRILHQLSVNSYDFVADLNLERDTYSILTSGKNMSYMPMQGSHSQWMAHVLQSMVVPKDKAQYVRSLEPAEIYARLEKEGSYTFSYSIVDPRGDIRTKNMTVFPVDLRLGRVCLVRTDITDSVREQQGLLNMIAYTFELAGFIHVHSNRFTVYTRQTVLENLTPYVIEHYETEIEQFANVCGTTEVKEEAHRQFRLETMLERLLEKPAGYDFVFPYQDKDGLRYKQINVLWGDANHRMICLVRADVTDMLEAERESKKSLENALALAEEANRAKSDFLSAMSHDIRTPMNAIMGMTALAAAHLDDRERIADCLQKISVSSRHLMSLINDVLDMSKIERSKIVLNRIGIFLPDLMEQLSSIMAPQAKAAGLEFRMDITKMRHQHFYGDALRINQILINLLSNAIKFTPEGGRVVFRVQEIPPAEHMEQVRYCFTVSDSGRGMSEAFLKDIFEPFARGDGVSRIEGTGLGLSITKGLVDLMGGQISVESQLNKGSTFRVELEFEPAKAQAVSRLKTVDMELEGLQAETIFAGRCFLVAEDNAINAEILCELLEMHGAKSVVRTDGAQAVEEFENTLPGTYDAILMDIQMPEMDGYQATVAIRRMERTDAKTIPIVAMTANAFSEDVQAAQNAGMTAHITKPIDLLILRMTLSKVLGNAGGV